MTIAGMFSFKDGKNTVEVKYPRLFEEIRAVIESVFCKKTRNQGQ